MPRVRYPEEPRVCRQCGAEWTQRDGKPARPYCTVTCRQEAEGFRSRADELVPEPPRAPTRTRVLTARSVLLTCVWCQTTTEVWAFPGPTPRYCGPDCRTAADRDGATDRMRRLRQRRQQPHNPLSKESSSS